MSAPGVHNQSHRHHVSYTNLPNRPTMPAAPPENADAATLTRYDHEMLQYQQKMASYNRRLQNLEQQQTEEQTKRSNLDKARHDVMMMIISNMK